MPAVHTTQDVRKLSEASREIVPPAMYVWDLPDTGRARTLAARASFCHGTQHSHYEENWGGHSRGAGTAYLDERLKPQGFVSTNSAPVWSGRKPDTPHGLPRQVVSRFTDLLLSEVGRPTLRVPADETTEAYVMQVMESSDSWASLQTARDYKGECGSAAIALSIQNGEPTTEALRTEYLWVRKWADSPQWIPSEVIEQKLVTKMIEDPKNPGELIEVNAWQTRVWTDTHFFEYEDVEEDYGKKKDQNEEVKPIPIESVAEHLAGRCPIVWMQNTRNTDSPEGREDFRGAYEESDKLDRVRSFSTRSTIANTDPTLVISDNERARKQNPMVRKGHGARIDTSQEGNVKLLETSGNPVKMGWETADQLRHDILQTTSCVIIDPETVGSHRSGEALQFLWTAMEARASRLRVPLGTEIRQISGLWIDLGRKHGVLSMEELDDGDQTEVEGIILPPRLIKKEGQEEPAIGVFDPGKGRYVGIEWGTYHRPTMLQLQALAGALTTVNGGKAVLSQETTTSVAVVAMGLGSPEEERERMEKEKAEAMKEREEIMGAGLSGSMFKGLDGAGDDDVRREQDKTNAGAANAAMKGAKAEKKEADKAKPTKEATDD